MTPTDQFDTDAPPSWRREVGEMHDELLDALLTVSSRYSDDVPLAASLLLAISLSHHAGLSIMEGIDELTALARAGAFTPANTLIH